MKLFALSAALLLLNVSFVAAAPAPEHGAVSQLLSRGKTHLLLRNYPFFAKVSLRLANLDLDPDLPAPVLTNAHCSETDRQCVGADDPSHQEEPKCLCPLHWILG